MTNKRTGWFSWLRSRRGWWGDGTTSPGTVGADGQGGFVVTGRNIYEAPGSYSIGVQISDAGGNTAAASSTAVIADESPTAYDALYRVTHDQSLDETADSGLTNYLYDPDDNVVLTIEPVVAPSHGTLDLNADGSFDYTPAAGFYGTDSFTYQAYDGVAASNPATVTLTVIELAPAAETHAYDLTHDQPLSVGAAAGVLAGASDPDGDAVSASLVSGPAHGSLTLNADGTFNYTPQQGYAGDDSFTWQASDGVAPSNTAVVILHVLDFGQVTPDHEYEVHAGTTLSVDSPGLLDSNGPGDQVGQNVGPLVPVLVSGPAHGTLTQFNADGSFVYVPAAGFLGLDTFTYRISNGVLPGNVATVTIDVTDTAPLAGDETFDVAAGGTLTQSAPGVLAGAFDPDADPLSAALVNGPAHAASFTLNPDGSFVYTPAPGFVGADSFNYLANDGVLGSNVATVTINVAKAPVTAEDTYVLPASGSLTVPVSSGVLSNDFDPAGLPLTATLFGVGPVDSSGVAHGVLTLKANGSFTYTPDPNYSGPVTFTYVAADANDSFGTQGTVAIEPAAAAPAVALKEVTFLGATTLKPDIGAPVKPGPQWTSKSQYDISYTANSRMKVRTVLAVTDPTIFKNKKVMVQGLVWSTSVSAGELQMNDPLEIDAAQATLTGNQVIGYQLEVTAQANRPFAPGAGYYSSLTILWEYSLDNGSTWTNVEGTSDNRLDITLNKPQGSNLFDTVVSLGSHALADAANLPAKPSTIDLSNAIFAAFETLNVQRVDDGKTLQYYGNWATTSLTTKTLLHDADGQCSAWAEFFIDVLRAQGITVPATALFQINPVVKGQAMLVGLKQWTFTPLGANGLTLAGDKATFSDPGGFGPLVGTKSYFTGLLGQPAEVTFVSGGQVGQGGGNPVASFGGHAVVQITVNGVTEVFDPSYGKSFTGADARQQLQDAEIAGFAAPGFLLGPRGIKLPCWQFQKATLKKPQLIWTLVKY